MRGSGHLIAAMLIAMALIASGCGGGDSGDSEGQASIGGDTVVIDPEDLAEAREDLEDTAAPEELTAGDVETADPTTDTATSESSGDGIEVAEAEEDELDGLLNSLTVFNTCLEDKGFEFIGAPGFDGGQPEDFEPAYMDALGACAAESDILAASEGFAEAQANLTPEEIELNNLGLPVFGECMEALGWEVAELVPDERGALGFGEGGTGLTPPGGGGISDFRPEDIDACRAEAEQYVQENTDIETAG